MRWYGMSHHGLVRTDRSIAVSIEESAPPALSRRKVLTAAAGAGVVVAAGGVLAASAGQTTTALLTTTDLAEAEPAGQGDAVVVHVRDAATGTLDVFVGADRIQVRDAALAARITAAARH
jgi:hypothetical protein